MTIVALMVSAVVALGSPGAVADAAGAAGSPKDWGAACSSQPLGLDKVTVQLAPALVKDPDRNPDGSPVRISVDARGKYTPIIMVHGWTSKDTHNDAREGTFSHLIDLTANRLGSANGDRSLVGQLQRIPGAAVFTFDYREYAARWVDDAHLGPALGKVIDCLYQASGEKVIVVGHSMGGLVARYAATHPGVKSAPDRSAEISTVITFGTPETGSLAALLSAVGTDGAGATTQALAVLRLILAACGKVSTSSEQSGSLCDTLPAPVRAFDSDAGIALRYGSRQLAALRPWPKGLSVHALAGQASFQVAKVGWFALPWDTTNVDVGDLIVTTGSALNGATQTRTVKCSYQLNAVREATDTIGLIFKTVSKADGAAQPLASLTGPCFHTQLMRGIELTNEATGVVNDDITSRQPVSMNELLDAPVPSLCGQKPGRLTDGKLKGVPPHEGFVELAANPRDVQAARSLIALGDLDGDGLGDAAAVFHCSQGGVGWPDWIVFYARGETGLRVLGAFDMATVTGEARDGVRKITYNHGSVHVNALDGRPNDPGCCASGKATLDLSWNGKRIVAHNVVHLIKPNDVPFTGVGSLN